MQRCANLHVNCFLIVIDVSFRRRINCAGKPEAKKKNEKKDRKAKVYGQPLVQRTGRQEGGKIEKSKGRENTEQGEGMKTAAIIQARLASTRFPGKVITPLGQDGKPAIQILIDRLSNCQKLDKIIIAIPTNEDEFYRLCRHWDFEAFRGSPDNVRERVLEAAKFYGVNKIVDITADCPLVDPKQVDALIQISSCYQYCSNIDPRTWPDGFDVQVYDTKLLAKVHKMNPATPHVGWQILDLIRRGVLQTEAFNLPAPQKLAYPNMRLTLDAPEDGIVIDQVLYHLGEHAPAKEIIEYMLEHPELQNINAKIRTKLPEEG